MPCVIQIKDDITSTIEEMSGNYTNKTPSFIKILQNTINNRFKVPVVTFLKQTDDTFLSKIHIPQSLIDEYYKNELLIEGERDAYEKEKKSLKKGVLELFDSNSELSKIGTPEQYSEYLDTIFPDSKVKDILYHGGTVQDVFRKETIGKSTINSNKNDFGQPYAFYFSTSKESSKTYGDVKQVILNIKNPAILEQSLEDNGFGLRRKNKFDSVKNLNLEEKDSFVLKDIFDAKYLETLSTKDLIEDTERIKQTELNKKIESQHGDTIGVFEPEQIHILGSKQDIEGVKEFINNKNYNNKNTSDSIFNEYGVTHEEWNNASESEREMIIWQSKNNC